MNKTRFAVKAVLTGVVTAVLVMGGTAGTAEAKDTGWGGVGIVSDGSAQTMKDTGWGGV